MKKILPIVEGEGDVRAVPALIRRVAIEHGEVVEIGTPHRRGDFPTVKSKFENSFKTAMLEKCPILWVLDYDCKECTDIARDETELVNRAKKISRDTDFEFVFFVKEFETIFLADHETTRAVFPDIDDELDFPNPETVRDAKGWISNARPKGSSYKPTQHQERLASRVDLNRLRERSPSFVRFEKAVLKLLALQVE